jgi:hypothetical protein
MRTLWAAGAAIVVCLVPAGLPAAARGAVAEAAGTDGFSALGEDVPLGVA